MTAPDRDMTTAWNELLDGLRDIDTAFLEGPRAVRTDQAAAEGYRTALTALGIALDTYLFADPSRPMFLDLTTPFRRDRRWGGDNTDCWYCFTPIDPQRTYRVSGHRGDSTYFCFTVYNQPTPGEWSNRVVANLNDTDLDIGDDGRFSFVAGAARPAGFEGQFLELGDDASIAFTRDYQVDPANGRRVAWEIEALDPPEPLTRTDAQTAAALRATLTWVQTLFGIVPLQPAPKKPETGAETTLGHNSPVTVNEFADPYQVVGATYGWSALDASYAFATFSIGPGEAIVVTHRPPTCRFWNLVVWNAFMATESLTDAPASINHGRAVPNSDGTVTVVISHDLLDHPNSITTGERYDGALAFRWFLADAVPDRPTLDIVRLADAPTRPT